VTQSGQGSNKVRVSEDALERAREIAPRWDVYWLQSNYIQWAQTLDPARNEDARFLGWVKSFTKGKLVS
jgi:hypothetical protein